MATAAVSACAVVFRSEAELEAALAPWGQEDVTRRVSGLHFLYDAHLPLVRQVPLRNCGTANLLETEVFRTKNVTVFYPQIPRVPHHLAIALNREGIRGVVSVTEEENDELFATIRTISEIYKSVAIQGFVVAQFDTPQEGHKGRYVVELIPHLPGFGFTKHTVDKADCNRYVLYRRANLSPVNYAIEGQEVEAQARFWKEAFQRGHESLDESDTRIKLPHTRRESHQEAADRLLRGHLLEILEDGGGRVVGEPSLEIVMSTEIPTVIKGIEVKECFFDKEDVIRRQMVYKYNTVVVLCNARKMVREGVSFLILPERHIEKIYGLTSAEIRDMGIVRRALVEVLKEAHPGCEVVIYTQDDPSVGQTVFHAHEQVVAIDPRTIALTWTMMSLDAHERVSDEELARVRSAFKGMISRLLETDRSLCGENTPLLDGRAGFLGRSSGLWSRG